MVRYIRGINEMVKTYRHRHTGLVVIAVQLAGTKPEIKDIFDWIKDQIGEFDTAEEVYPDRGVAVDRQTGGFLLLNEFGMQHTNFGDWIIKNSAGDFYSVSRTWFDETYEEVKP